MSSPEAPVRLPVVVVTGPTASGKTPLAIELALRFAGEIVNADSMQVFRYMDIGTAKPSPAERARVPHHLIDVVTPKETYSAGRYARDARAAIAGIHARGHVPLLTGGTGLYLRAVLHGHAPLLWRRARELRIPCTAPGVAYGTQEMAREMARLYRASALPEQQILVMTGHEDGVIAFGRSVDEAGQVLVTYLARALRPSP